MYSQAWTKYFPVIKILIKKSAIGNQTLDMNKTDFERASAGRKTKLNFSVTLHNGRVQNISAVLPPVGRELVNMLQEDPAALALIRQYHLEFSMNSSFQLLIKNTTPADN